jgi:hypothetical protein
VHDLRHGCVFPQRRVRSLLVEVGARPRAEGGATAATPRSVYKLRVLCWFECVVSLVSRVPLGGEAACTVNLA